MEFNASWIGPAYDPKQDIGFFVFSLDFNLNVAPDKLLLRVSADQRYKLLVNGATVSRGPQRGDAQHWFYETIDIASHLTEGENWISAEVTNFGWMAPMAQHSVRTAFLLEAEAPFEFLSTPGDWQVKRRLDREFAMMSEGVGQFYIDVGPGEIQTFDPSFVYDEYRPAHRICRAEIRGENGGGSPWSLSPSMLPSESANEAVSPVRVFGSLDVREDCSFSIPKDQQIVLDFGQLLVGYPSFWFACDEEPTSSIRITYCESLTDENGTKGDRDEVSGLIARGYEDRIQLRGAQTEIFVPSWLRTCRYVAIESEVEIKRAIFQIVPSGYPMDFTASFESDEPSIPPIWDMCVRTLKLCAGETYYDCPYYEQLQYVGDTRLQALIGYYLSRDRRLQRNAIEQFHWSILENGLTQSRYPSRQMQVIPPFSLWWVVMLYDAWMHHDPEFDPNPYITSATGVLEAYHRILKGEIEPFWCFGDWLPEWKWGVPPGGPAAEMHLVLLEMATWCLAQLKGENLQLKRPDRGDQGITEHAESLWRYAQTLAGQTPDPWDEASLQGAPRCTYFWQFVKHVGMHPDDYVAQLEPWREMLKLGLTTTPETPEPTRSDCHGWSAHPPLGLLQIVAGVTSAAPGWKKVRIAPRPGSLERFVATIPHPEGDIVVRYENGDIQVECPVPFELDWNRS